MPLRGAFASVRHVLRLERLPRTLRGRVHRLPDSHWRYRDLQRDGVWCGLSLREEALRWSLHRGECVLLGGVPERLARLFRGLRVEHQRDDVRHIVHGLHRSGQLGRHLYERHVWIHLQDGLQTLWRCVHCEERVLRRHRLSGQCNLLLRARLRLHRHLQGVRIGLHRSHRMLRERRLPKPRGELRDSDHVAYLFGSKL